MHNIEEPKSKKVGQLLNTLRSIQENLGHIPQASIHELCKSFNLSYAEMYGFIAFYKDFRLEPNISKHHIRLCQAESCQAKNVKTLTEYIKNKLNLNIGEHNKDFFLDSVYCLGNCPRSPSIMIDGLVYGDMGEEKFDEILNKLRNL
ncbi:NAD-dependent formate dehydrogenase gamma subunit [Desulfurella amilsii]|uniref:NAD-dependent formate dehydrogenase gamma subunit n=1 Tax=Desulfurella amilsii TaxID=1562698 RepID=A0A1X4XVU5_9BACT|nr:NAD(P)H-dependent oxidoreductase subunit E [Desulfurella amilsii]OSS41628.1 NAD-dependent formate dehydrogenase gamma subunit [Desulfurella amilsii]